MTKKLFQIATEAKDKARDDALFNCSQQHEIDYVASRYPQARRDEVKQLLLARCKDKTFHHATHAEVYAQIRKELGLEPQ